jgi:hypothetical protein
MTRSGGTKTVPAVALFVLIDVGPRTDDYEIHRLRPARLGADRA